MSPNESRCCGKCEFANIAGTASIGFCRRYPPALISQPGAIPQSQFPPVDLVKFVCGEFKPRLDS